MEASDDEAWWASRFEKTNSVIRSETTGSVYETGSFIISIPSLGYTESLV